MTNNLNAEALQIHHLNIEQTNIFLKFPLNNNNTIATADPHPRMSCQEATQVKTTENR